jgi:hypothetical protein
MSATPPPDADADPGPVLGSLRAALYDPHLFEGIGGSVARGWSSHRLVVHPRRIVVAPTGLGRRLGARQVVYSWPAVVVKRRRLLPIVDVLVDVDGKLGEVTLIGRGPRIRALLEQGGFAVVDVRARDVLSAQPISRRDAGSLVSQLPTSVVARS